jgi:hypothetical protein
VAKESHCGYLEPKNEELFEAKSDKWCTLKNEKRNPSMSHGKLRWNLKCILNPGVPYRNSNWKIKGKERWCVTGYSNTDRTSSLSGCVGLQPGIKKYTCPLTWGE